MSGSGCSILARAGGFLRGSFLLLKPLDKSFATNEPQSASMDMWNGRQVWHLSVQNI
jgi:hypothetical protein